MWRPIKISFTLTSPQASSKTVIMHNSTKPGTSNSQGHPRLSSYTILVSNFSRTTTRTQICWIPPAKSRPHGRQLPRALLFRTNGPRHKNASGLHYLCRKLQPPDLSQPRPRRYTRTTATSTAHSTGLPDHGYSLPRRLQHTPSLL
jgi:hypothetical protein